MCCGANSEVANSEVSLFSNKFPSDPIGDTKIVPNSRLSNISGNFDYVIDADGNLVVGKSGHTSLANGADVQAAGEIQLYNGNVKWVDNASGHYQPTGPGLSNLVESTFNDIGLDTTGKFEYKTWVPDPTLPRGGSWK